MASPITTEATEADPPEEHAPNPGRALFLLIVAARHNPSSFALRVGVSRSTVSAWINGVSRMDKFKAAHVRDLLGEEIPGAREPIPEDVFSGSEADVYRYLTRRLGESRSSHRHLIVA
jgi:hypothetical protein